MKNTCKKFCYPYPKECVYVLYFADKNNKVIYDIVISSDTEGVIEYIDSKKLYGLFQYLGYVNVNVLSSINDNNYNSDFLRIYNDKKEELKDVDTIISLIKEEKMNQCYLIDLTKLNIMKKEIDNAIKGLKCVRTPIYIYSSDEINECLAE